MTSFHRLRTGGFGVDFAAPSLDVGLAETGLTTRERYLAFAAWLFWHYEQRADGSCGGRLFLAAFDSSAEDSVELPSSVATWGDLQFPGSDFNRPAIGYEDRSFYAYPRSFRDALDVMSQPRGYASTIPLAGAPNDFIFISHGDYGVAMPYTFDEAILDDIAQRLNIRYVDSEGATALWEELEDNELWAARRDFARGEATADHYVSAEANSGEDNLHFVHGRPEHEGRPAVERGLRIQSPSTGLFATFRNRKDGVLRTSTRREADGSFTVLQSEMVALGDTPLASPAAEETDPPRARADS